MWTTIGDPLSVLRAVPLGASGPGALLRVHVPIIYSPPPAPGSAHHGDQEDSRPPSLRPLSSLPLTLTVASSLASQQCPGPSIGDIWVLLLREQEILLHSALGVGVTSATQLAVGSDPRDRKSAVSTFALKEQQHIFNGPCTYICMCIYICVCVAQQPSGVLYSYLREETQEDSSGGIQVEESKAKGPGAAI